MIRLLNVSKIYHDGKSAAHKAIDDVTLVVARGQITVLKGPSGSGKTTLLSLIGCMTRPTSGRIFFGDKEVTSLPERFLTVLRRDQVGFVFQNYNLIKGITVLENVMLPALPLGGSIRTLRKKAGALLADLEMGDFETRQVQYLSGGEQQRVAIARALVNKPKLVIADEPTAHLDSALSEQLMAIVRQIKDQGRTMLIASHDPLVYNHPMIDRVVTLHDGCIQNGADAQ